VDRHDAPAALPLLALAIGLLTGGNALPVCALAALVWRLHRHAAIALAFLAFGMLGAASHVPPQFAENRFVTIEAPIESDWSVHDHVQVLRSSRFTANGVTIDAPLSIYARFALPPVERQARIRAEGILRSTNGRYSFTLKSPRLMAYEGEISTWAPST